MSDRTEDFSEEDSSNSSPASSFTTEPAEEDVSITHPDLGLNLDVDQEDANSTTFSKSSSEDLQRFSIEELAEVTINKGDSEMPTDPQSTREMAPEEDLTASWVEQYAELNRMKADKRDDEERLSRLETQLESQSKELLDVKKVKNSLEPKILKVEKELDLCLKDNSKLKDERAELQKRVWKLSSESIQSRRETDGLRNLNATLGAQIQTLRETITSKENVISDLDRERTTFIETDLQKNIQEAEVAKLQNELKNAKDMMERMAQLQTELEGELQEVTEEEAAAGEASWTSLDDELFGPEDGGPCEYCGGGGGGRAVEAKQASTSTQTEAEEEAGESQTTTGTQTKEGGMVGVVPASITSGTQTEGERVDTKVMCYVATQTEKEVEKAAKGGSPIIWWIVLLVLVVLWEYSRQSEKGRWMEANEATRQMTVGLRDEGWFGPMWLERAVFSAESYLSVDRIMLA